MAVPQLTQTVLKVDQAVARLQQLQSAVARKNPPTGTDVSPRCRRRFKGRNKCEMKKFHEVVKMTNAPESSGDNWRRWSSPAEYVHQAISEILVASKFAKEVAEMVTDVKKYEEEAVKKNDENSARETVLRDPTRTTRVIQSTMNTVPSNSNGIGRQNNRMMTQKALEREEAGRKRREALANEKFPRIMSKEPPKAVQRFRVVTPMKAAEVKKATVDLTRREASASVYYPQSEDSKKLQVASSLSSSSASSCSRLRRPAANHCASSKKVSESGLEKPAIRGQVSHIAAFKKTPARIHTPQAPTFTPKIPTKLRPPFRSARVSNSPESPPVTIGKFAVRVAEISTAHRPWSLTPSRPSKPVIMFPNPTFAPFSIPTKSTKDTPSKLLPGLTSNSTRKLSPLKSLKGVKLKSPVAKSPVFSTGKKPGLAKKGSEDKQALPVMPLGGGSVTGKKQGWLSKRLSITPPRSIRRISLLGKQEFSPVKPLPSLITRLPARRRGTSCLQSRVEPAASKKSASGLGKPVNEVAQGMMMSPLPMPPALRAEELRAAQMNKAAAFAQPASKRSVSCPRQLRPIDRNSIPTFRPGRSEHNDKGRENNNTSGKMEDEEKEELKDCAMPFPGCGATVWPVLRRSWSFGNENNFNCSSRTNTGPSILKNVKGWKNLRTTKSKDHGLLT